MSIECCVDCSSTSLAPPEHGSFWAEWWVGPAQPKIRKTNPIHCVWLAHGVGCIVSYTRTGFFLAHLGRFDVE